MRNAAISIKKLNKKGCRFEGEHYLNDDSFLSMKIEDLKNVITLESIAYVFNPPVFRRQFCSKTNKSVPYFQSSDVQKTSEKSNVYVFSEQAKILNLLVNQGDILITGFGTIGNTRLVNKHQDKVCYANNVCRVRTNEGISRGYIYAFLSSKYGKAQLNKNGSGSVVRYIEAPGIKKTLIPEFPKDFQEKIDGMIKESSLLREETTDILVKAEKLLKQKTNLQDLKPEDYNYFGTHCFSRKITSFNKNISEIGSITFNAFNHSEKIEEIKQRISNSVKLSEILLGNKTFSTGSFPRVEVKAPYGVKLINQTDAFDNIIIGKNISLRKVNLTNLVEYGEVIVAGVGTLGENETFCRTLFANEDLEGQLISGEFIRMKTNDKIPSGYLFTWLNSDYGFRFIRHIHTGTKLCRPIPKLFLEIPIPLLKKEDMEEIDQLVKSAHSKQHKANMLELEAIALVEAEIEKWTKE